MPRLASNISLAAKVYPQIRDYCRATKASGRLVERTIMLTLADQYGCRPDYDSVKDALNRERRETGKRIARILAERLVGLED